MDCDPTIEVDIGRVSLEKLLFKLLLQTKDHDKATYVVNNLRYLSSEYGDYRTDPDVENYLNRMLAREIKRELDRELGNAGVLSLSATWQSALMWSHYADEHRGICIEYDTTDQEHPHLGPVGYRGLRAVKASDLWRWKFREDAASKETVRQTYFFSKSLEWRYEREWRDVKANGGTNSLPFRMSAIHFGMRCDGAVVTSIVKLLADHPEIKLWQILPKDDSFRLRRSLVSRDEIEAMGVREPAFLMFKDIVWPDLDEPAEPEPDGDDIPEVEPQANS
jgi:hypothetical protein